VTVNGAPRSGAPREPASEQPDDTPLDLLFGSLADRTRRRLLERLILAGPNTATRLTEGTDITRQAVTKHLQALEAAGLVRPVRCGREVRYTATPEPLAEAIAWMIQSSPDWDRRMSRLNGSAARRTR